MRIAIYSGEIPSTTFIENLINGLGENGHEILLFGTQKHKVDYKKEVKILATPKSRLLILLYVLYQWLCLRMNSGADVRKVKSIIHQKKVSGFKNRIYFLARVLPVLNNKPDIFHVQWIKGGIYWDFLPEFGIKLVGSFRGAHINYTPLIETKYQNEYRESFPHFSAFHAVSKAIAVESLKYGSEMEKIAVIPGAVNPLLFNTTTDYKKKETIIIISIGRFHWKKGYHIALDALKLLKERGIKFEYHIVGGVGVEDIPFQRRDLGLEKEVQFIDRMPHNQVLELYKKADLYLLPSVEEGIANVVLEAMALGVPVVSTNCGGMAEVISNKENGFLVPIRDPEAICEAITEFNAMDVDQIQAMISKAKETIKKNHLIPNQILKFEGMYKSLLTDSE